MLIPTSVQSIAGRGKLVAQRFAPEILTGVGLASMTGGAILAVKATLKLEFTLDQAQNRIAEVKLGDYDTRSQEVLALRKTYIVNALEFTKLYGPAISLFSAGIASVLVGHGILQKRNAALVAAYNALQQSFNAYRARVIEDLGIEKDRDYRLGITETNEKGEDGKKVTKTDVDPTKMSKYARVFDETNINWQSDPDFNQFFVISEQNHMNDLLLARGHVFLNEVYDRLGFKRTHEGGVVGWKLSKDGGDNHIDFGIYDANTQQKRNFINGYERSIWLDFNVDGPILFTLDD